VVRDEGRTERVGRTRAVVKALLPGALLLTVGACAPADSSGGVRWATEFEYFRRGGLCPTGSGGATCELRVVVRDDGTWSASGVPAPPADGTLPIGAASELSAIFGQSWRYFTEELFTGVCPTAYDGQEYGYVERRIPYGPGAEAADMSVREVRSCVHDLDRYESLVKRNLIEEAWKGIKPPELAHVEFR
jgi:hypothetical protein